MDQEETHMLGLTDCYWACDKVELHKLRSRLRRKKSHCCVGEILLVL